MRFRRRRVHIHSKISRVPQDIDNNRWWNIRPYWHGSKQRDIPWCMKCAQYEVLFLPRGGVDPPGLHGRAVRAENDQPTAAKPLDPESILFYILDIWLMYEALYGSKSPIFHIPHIAHVKICYNLCYTRKFLNLTGLDVPIKLFTTTSQSHTLK